MSGPAGSVPTRDSQKSVFCAILSRLEEDCSGFRAAIFFDGEGETIDYHSFLDPFETRLLAAHVGVIVSSADFRSGWIGMGRLEQLVIFASNMDIIVMPLGEGLSVAVVVDAGEIDDGSAALVSVVAAQLRTEAGL